MGRRAVTGSAASTAATTPSTVPVASIASNPRNPRDHYDDVGDLTASIQAVGILQPIGVVRYEIFLTHYPEHEHEVGTYDWVAVNGNRRLAAAKSAGLSEVPVIVLDRLGRDNQLDEAALIENIHREALPPLREAQALRLLVDRYGRQSLVAQRIGKTEGFVSQRLGLLKLEPELKTALSAGQLSIRDARTLSKVPAVDQVAEWERLQNLYLVKTEPSIEPGEPAARGEQAPHLYPAKPEPQASSRPGLDEKSASSKPLVRGSSIKVGSPSEIADQLRQHLTPEDLATLGKLLLE